MKRKIVDKKQKSPKQKVDYAILFRHLKKHKGKLIVYSLIMLCNIVVTLATLTVITEVVNSLAIPDLNRVIIYLIAYSCLFCLERLNYIVAYRIFRKIIQDAEVDMRNELSNRIFSINSKSYNQVETGEFIGRVTHAPADIIIGVWDLFDSVILVLSGVIICFYVCTMNIWIGILLVVYLAVLAVVEKFRMVASSKRRKESKKAEDGVNSFVNEVVRSEKDVKALNLEQSFKKQANDIYYKESYLSRKANGFAFDSFSLVLIGSEIFILGTLLLGAFFVTKDLMAIGILTFLIMNIDRIKNLGLGLGSMTNSMAGIRTQTMRLNDIFDESKYALEKFGNEDFDNEFEGNIELKNVSFSYDGENNIIDDMSLVIPKGKTVAFVGKSGSGKTTLVSLISKLYEVTGGELYLDDKNINDLSKDALRKNIALINQFPYIFDSSIRKNLSISNENATEEDMWEVLEQANLKEFVQELSGYCRKSEGFCTGGLDQLDDDSIL